MKLIKILKGNRLLILVVIGLFSTLILFWAIQKDRAIQISGNISKDNILQIKKVFEKTFSGDRIKIIKVLKPDRVKVFFNRNSEDGMVLNKENKNWKIDFERSINNSGGIICTFPEPFQQKILSYLQFWK